MVVTIADGSEIVTVVVAVHPFTSVAVIEYIPDTTLDRSSEKVPFDHKKVNPFPTEVISTEPLLPPLQLTFVELLIATEVKFRGK